MRLKPYIVLWKRSCCMNTTLSNIYCKCSLIQSKILNYTCTKTTELSLLIMGNDVTLTQYLDIYLIWHNHKKALDYDGNVLPRSVKSRMCNIFEKKNSKTLLLLNKQWLQKNLSFFRRFNKSVKTLKYYISLEPCLLIYFSSDWYYPF